MTISDFSAVDGVTVGSEVGDADANTPYVTLDDVAIYKQDLVLITVFHIFSLLLLPNLRFNCFFGLINISE